MKTIFFALLFLSACSTFQPKKPVAKFEPSTPQTFIVRSLSSNSKIELDKNFEICISKNADKLWFQADRPKDSLIRSNPSHYWAWMACIRDTIKTQELKDAIQYVGQITADPHFFNFADVHSSTHGGLALVDIDDSGKGSFFFDFLRYAIFVKAYLNEDITSELFGSYLRGLSRESLLQPPPVLKKPIDGTRAALEKSYYKWIDENFKNEKLNNKELGLEGFKDISVVKKKIGEELEKALVKQGKMKKIDDHGYIETDSGSSRGMARYWFGGKSIDHNNQIIECKELSEPATANYMKQKQHKDRVEDVLEFYADVKTPDSYVFNLPPNNSYWCRKKEFQFLKRKDVEKDLNPDELHTYSAYLAYWLGKNQRAQNGADKYAAQITTNKLQVLNGTLGLIDMYENDIAKFKQKKK